MPSKIIDNILKKTGTPDLLEVLSDSLNSGELQSLLLEVFSRKTAEIDPAKLLRNYKENRFVGPSEVLVSRILAFDQMAYDAASGFQALELAPVAPLGSCAALGTVHQNKVISALRNTEVVSDSTNLLALETALRRQNLLSENAKSREAVRLCSSHRLVRGQYFEVPGFTAHFRVFALVSGGRDEGHFRFEVEELYRHFNFYLQMLAHANMLNLEIGKINVGITLLNDAIAKALIEEKVFQPLRKEYSQVHFYFNDERQSGRGYYRYFCFNIDVQNPDSQLFNLGDGVCTDWTQKLLQNKKERLLISGFGSELFCKLFSL